MGSDGMSQRSPRVFLHSLSDDYLSVIRQGFEWIALGARLKQGKATSLDVEQAKSNVAQTEASIPPLVIGLRQATDKLCVLLGQPARDILRELNDWIMRR